MRLQYIVVLGFLFTVQRVCISILCPFCQTSVALSIYVAQAIIPHSVLIEAITIFCDRIYQSQKVCTAISESFTPLAISSVLKGFLLNHNVICQKVCRNYEVFDVPREVDRILNGERPNNLIKLLPYEVELSEVVLKPQGLDSQVKTVKLLHLSDIHLDLNYAEGSSIFCEYPICCHSDNGFPNDTQQKAPQYGSPQCDAPQKLFHSALNFIQSIGGVDIAIVTGDYSAHNEWQKSQLTIKHIRQMVNQQLKESQKISLLIENMGNNDYLPDHQMQSTSQTGDLIKVHKITVKCEFGLCREKELVFVSLNTVVCDNLNLNLILSQSTAIQQLITFEKILEDYDDIYILSHIAPTAQSCSSKYREIFRALLAQYSHKIRGQFYGHSHLDEFHMFTHPKRKDQLVGFGFGVGSLSPFFVGSSTMRIYEINPQVGVTDYTDFIMTDFQKPSWRTNYRLRDYYGIKGNNKQALSLLNFAQFRHGILVKKDSDLLMRYRAKTQKKVLQKGQQCNMFDDQQQRSKCFNTGKTFKTKINDLLEILQGRWGFIY